jgi:drug/metabolite transporter (DMT)-like permease
VVGLIIALAFGVYFGINPKSESRGAVIAATVSFVLCPGSLLFVTFIDAEPWTNGSIFMWLAVAIINTGVYGFIGHLVGRFLWRSS